MRLFRSSALAVLLVSSLGFVACAAPEGDDASSNADALTEKKIVEVETYVIGQSAYGVDEAKASFRTACDAWGSEQRALLGSKLLDYRCGDGENLTPDGNTSLFGGAVKARLVVALEQGTTPASSRTKVAVGKAAYGFDDAAKSWRAACSAESKRAKELYGDRLLFTSCPKPQNLTPNGNTLLLASDHQVLLAPASGKTTGLDVDVRGKAAYGADDGYASFDAACVAMGKQMQAIAGAHLVTVDCGSPANVTPNGNTTTFGAKAHVEVTTGDAALAPVVSTGLFASGDAAYSADDAQASLTKRCDETTALAKELLGARLIASACGASTNVTPEGNTTLLRAPVTVVAMPAGATKVEVEQYVVGKAAYGVADAEASFRDAARAAVRAQVTRTGAARVEGFASATPENLTPSGNTTLLGATVKVLVGVDVAEGGIPPVSSTDRVRGEPAYGADDALQKWAAACQKAVDKAKADQGDRFLAGGCQKPVAEPTGNTTAYASDVTVWLLP